MFEKNVLEVHANSTPVVTMTFRCTFLCVTNNYGKQWRKKWVKNYTVGTKFLSEEFCQVSEDGMQRLGVKNSFCFWLINSCNSNPFCTSVHPLSAVWRCFDKTGPQNAACDPSTAYSWSCLDLYLFDPKLKQCLPSSHNPSLITVRHNQWSFSSNCGDGIAWDLHRS